MRVLFVAYFFPPVGGSGVQRTVKFIRYLPDFGISSSVVAGPVTSHGVGEPRDVTLSGELPPGTEVLRALGPEPQPSTQWRGRLERWGRLQTPWSRWWIDGVVEAGRGANGIDAIIATGSPFESFAAAARLARTLGVPWIADLRDPWALDEMQFYPTALHRRLELRRMEHWLRPASAVIMNTPEAARSLADAFPSLASTRIACIPNGYDHADFVGDVELPTGGPFRIAHVGSLHTMQGTEHLRFRRARHALGGVLGDVDILTRSHVFLLQAIEQLVDEDPALASEIEFHLAGDLSTDDKAAIGLDLVRQHGYLDHGSSVLLTRTADLLFLPMHDLPVGQRARIVPGKTYEYLAAGRPILAAVPDGDARDLVGQAANSNVVRPRDVAGMAQAIRAQIERRRRGEPAPSIDPAVLARYERRELTKQLASLVGDVVAAR